MIKNYSAILLILGCHFSIQAQITPEISSWILNTTGDKGYANIPSNVQQVQYSTGNVYVSATCIPGYDIGPWAGNPNTPANQNFVFKITRNPQQNTGTAIATGLGHIGVFTNGVSIFNPKDAMSYMNQNVWYQNAIVVEGPSFDNCLGHPAPNGEYHLHLNPTCLYDDSLTTVHSPIIGYSFDGFPIYGAFAYANANGSGGIKRMQSSYRMRNITKRTLLPDGSTASAAGPDVSGSYPLGYYVQDFNFAAGSGDLDEHNGRFSVTPEYPAGIYCYFVSLDSSLVPEYPYILGPTYYGTVQSGNTGPGSGHNTVTETVTTYNGNAGAEELKEIGFDIFPNPANGIIQIITETFSGNNLHMEITNPLGKVIYSQNNIQPGISYTIDVSELARGVYCIHLKSTDSRVTKLFVLN